MRISRYSLLSALFLSVAVLGHPGHDPTEEILERRAFMAASRRASLGHCVDRLQERGVPSRNVQRRATLMSNARLNRGIDKRDAASVLATSHNGTSLGYTENTNVAKLFSSNNSCLLMPEVTQGPYCM
jgi:hypothetical protein